MPSGAIPSEPPALPAMSKYYREEDEKEGETALEAMLERAEQLANQIKESSASSRAGGSSTSSFVRGNGSLPGSIEMKDNATECSSVGYSLLLSSTMVDLSAQRTATSVVADDELEFNAGPSMLSSDRGSAAGLPNFEEKKTCDADGPPANVERFKANVTRLQTDAPIGSNVAVDLRGADTETATTDRVSGVDTACIARPEEYERAAPKYAPISATADLPAAAIRKTHMHDAGHANNLTRGSGAAVVSNKDKDGVSVVDYNSKISRDSRPSGGVNRGDLIVAWERVSSARKGDDDYVPLSDYSSLRSATSHEMDSPEVLELTYSERRASIRRKRKKRRRRLVMLIVVSAFVLGSILLRRFWAVVEDEEDSGTKVVGEVVGEVKDEALVADVDYDQEPVWKEDDGSGSDSAGVVVMDGSESFDAEFTFCQLPLAWIISPICRSELKIGFRLPEAQEKRRLVEELIGSMMQ